jgi:uncharacterized protein (TIGR02270 family)
MLDIIEEHFAELDFLWQIREDALFAPDWTLSDLAGHEARAEAHLDALRLARAEGLKVARLSLVGDDVFAACAAARVLMESRDPEAAREVLDALCAATPESRRGVQIGLRHSDLAAIAPELEALTGETSPEIAAAAMEILAFQRRPIGDAASRLAGAEASTQLNLYRALEFSASLRDRTLLELGLSNEDPTMQRAALCAAARSRLPDLAACVRWAAAKGQPEALCFLGVVGDASDLELLIHAVGREEQAAAAIRGLGALGCIQAVPLLLEWMRTETLAAAAGAAFVRLTGLNDLARRPAERPPVRENELRDKVRQEDALALDEADEELELPDPDRARAIWEAQAGAFDADGVWQCGRNLGQTLIGPAFGELSLQARRDTYLRACSRPGAPPPYLNLELAAHLQRPSN